MINWKENQLTYLGHKQVKGTVFKNLFVWCAIAINFQLQATSQNSFKLKLSQKLVFDQVNLSRTFLTDFFPFPLSDFCDSIPFFFERQLGCLSYILTPHAIPRKMQSNLKSKGIAECDGLIRLIASPFHWPSLADAADHFKWLLMWSEDFYSKLHFSWAVNVLVSFDSPL